MINRFALSVLCIELDRNEICEVTLVYILLTWTMLLMLTLSLYGAPRCCMSCNVPAADFFRYVISNLVFEILFSTRAKSKRLTYMPMATTSPRLNTQGLSVVVRNFCRGPSSSDTSFRLHGRAVVARGSRGTASGECGAVAGGSRATAGGVVASGSRGTASGESSMVASGSRATAGGVVAGGSRGTAGGVVAGGSRGTAGGVVASGSRGTTGGVVAGGSGGTAGGVVAGGSRGTAGGVVAGSSRGTAGGVVAGVCFLQKKKKNSYLLLSRA